MKCFLVEGNIKDAGRMTDEIMNEHMAWHPGSHGAGDDFLCPAWKADMRRRSVCHEGRACRPITGLPGQ